MVVFGLRRRNTSLSFSLRFRGVGENFASSRLVNPGLPSWDLFEDKLKHTKIAPQLKDALSLRNLPILKLGRSPYMQASVQVGKEAAIIYKDALLTCIFLWLQLTAHEGDPDFSNFLYQIPDTKKFVMLDREGPGCLHRAFFATAKIRSADMELILDGRVIFSGNSKELFSNHMTERFPAPFSEFQDDWTGTNPM